MALSTIGRNQLNTGIDDNSDATAITIDSSENVGVGTTTPGSFYSLADDIVVGTGSGGRGLTIYSGSSDSGYIGFNDTASAGMQGFIQYNHNGDYMALAPNGSEKVRITSAGNVGIRTTTPDVTSDGTAARAFLAVQGSGNRGVLNLGTSSSAGADIATINFNNGANAAASIVVDSDSGSTSAGSMLFYTNATQRFKIDSSGQSYFFNAPQNSGQANFYSVSEWAISVRRPSAGSAGMIRFENGTSYVGGITTSTTATQYNTSSDHRLKENVADITGAIARVKQLAPKRFNFIADDSVTVDGFLAHEAQTVVPEAVHGTHNEVDADGNAVMQGIDQSKLVPLLTGALQEAIAKIETLETKVAALEAG